MVTAGPQKNNITPIQRGKARVYRTVLTTVCENCTIISVRMVVPREKDGVRSKPQVSWARLASKAETQISSTTQRGEEWGLGGPSNGAGIGLGGS